LLENENYYGTVGCLW